jgi:cyclopropane fatty-acyl-phospholipid synthase-like methyltransferase
VITPATANPNLADIAAHYDDLDDLYRSIWGTNIHHGYWMTGRESSDEAVNNLTRLVAEHAAIRPGDCVCDLGCGYGAAALALNRDHGATVTGITISAKQYAYATQAASGYTNVNFMLGDALLNGLPTETFDAVITIEGTEHIETKTKLFREARRILRAGGRFVVTAWLARERPATWEIKYLLEPICTEGRLPNLASTNEFRRMLEDAGFRQVEHLDLTRAVKKTWTFCALRLIKRFLRDPALRRRLCDPHFTNRVFAKTVFRIRLAYAIGAMRYGLFSATK